MDKTRTRRVLDWLAQFFFWRLFIYGIAFFVVAPAVGVWYLTLTLWHEGIRETLAEARNTAAGMLEMAWHCLKTDVVARWQFELVVESAE